MDGSGGVGMYDWADQRVHLAHVAAQPEQPAASSSQDQAYLYQLLVGPLRNPVATGCDSAPDQSKKDDWQS